MTQPANLFGSCLATLPDQNGVIDLTPDMRMATGVDVLSQSLIRRQTTPRGSVITSPNDCIDIRQMISLEMSPSQVQGLAQRIKTELQKDQRVRSAGVTVTLDTTTGTCTIKENIDSALGPFSLTISLSNGTITQILQGQ